MTMDGEKSFRDESERDGFKDARFSDCSAGLDLEGGFNESKVFVEMSEKDCRICSLGLESPSCRELGLTMVLGCSCKDDLAFAHQKCAETWFNIKGDRFQNICFMCDSGCREAGNGRIYECLSGHYRCMIVLTKLYENCEICGSMVKNLVGFHAAETTGRSIGSSDNAATETQTQQFFQGNKLISCLLGGFLVVAMICFALNQLK